MQPGEHLPRGGRWGATTLEEAHKVLRMAPGDFVITQFNPVVNGLGAETFTAMSVHGQCECEGSPALRRHRWALVGHVYSWFQSATPQLGPSNIRRNIDQICFFVQP